MPPALSLSNHMYTGYKKKMNFSFDSFTASADSDKSNSLKKVQHLYSYPIT